MKNNKKLADSLRNNYSEWKSKSLEDGGYFVIFNGLQSTDKLKNISGNALKLYIYLGLNSDNFTGEVWHSNKKISKYFNKSERTIRYWMTELESLNLIKRFQLDFNGESHVFLQPYEIIDPLIKDKYVYTYRLKNPLYRETIDLKIFEYGIIHSLQKHLPKCYIKVKSDIIQILSYKPIETRYLRSISKVIKKDIPEFNNYIKTYSYKNSDGTIGYNHHLFERVRK